MALKPHLIGGEWVAGSEARGRHQPVGHQGRRRRSTRAPTGRLASARSRPPRRRSRPGRAARRSSASTCSTRPATRSSRARQELGELLAREEGKTLAEGIGEAARAGQIFKFFAGEALRLAGERLPSVRPGVEVEITREPVGVVGLITPWNFPIAIPAWKIAPALAYGNCVVFKPADLVPGCAWALADILQRAGVPEGVFNLVMGRGSVVGEALLDGAGRRRDQLHRLGRHRPARSRRSAPRGWRKFQLEMGGKNPLVVLDDADLDDRRRLRGQRRLLLDRPALHGVLAADRHRGHPRPLRRGAGRAA